MSICVQEALWILSDYFWLFFLLQVGLEGTVAGGVALVAEGEVSTLTPLDLFCMLTHYV
jgi:hypothetical protein